jgi:hypothetical protein
MTRVWRLDEGMMWPQEKFESLSGGRWENSWLATSEI